tara:strand:+ start:3887 stop:4825 length:939 start_codon:yes stop_codon:yes gene_type:complete
MSLKVLITGGAGYVGTVLTDLLLRNNFEVTVVDNLLFNNGTALIGFFKNPNFSFIKGDIRDEALMKKAVAANDVVVHLAAIVGFPACQRDPEMAKSVNIDGTKILSNLLSKEQIVIYSSTGSNYGEIKDGLCTEETPLAPLSLYGRTKTFAEELFLEKNSAIAYRFATAFGLSPKMRLDLLINDFVHQAFTNKCLIMFERTFKRTFIHVDDMADSVLFAINNSDRMKGEAFNIGGVENNFSKEEIALLIKSKIDFYLHYAEFAQDQDKRNYLVSYDKINSLGWQIKVSVEEGIEDMIKSMPALQHKNPYKNA